MGNDNSVTALHRDNYENIYCQIMGNKHFILLPPLAAAGVKEQWIKGATYQEDMTFKLDKDDVRVPCAMWDPDEPISQATSFSRLCRPLRVTIEPGDMLYLPACWYVSEWYRSSNVFMEETGTTRSLNLMPNLASIVLSTTGTIKTTKAVL